VAPTQFSTANTVRVVLEAIDQPDLDTIEGPTAPDVDFRFGNADPTQTKSELLAAGQSYRAAISGIHREFVDICEIGNGTAVAILDDPYRRRHVRELNPPCCNVFRVSDGLVRDYRIYLDTDPVIVARGGPVGVGGAVGRSMRFYPNFALTV
jgi:ketosteroid isomerase-like protein